MTGLPSCKERQRWYPLLVAMLGIIVYAGSVAHPFIFDDGAVILGNKEIKQILPLNLSSRMVADLSFSLNYALGRYHVSQYRAVNILIHICAALALYGLIRRSLLLPGTKQLFGRASSELALISAALWVVHPLQTESVTYVCQRYESMAGMFVFASMYCFVRGTSEKPRLWFDLALLCGVLGVCVKQNVVVLPVVSLVYDWIFTSHSFRDLLRRRWRVHLALFGLWGVFAMLLLMGTGKLALAGGALFSKVSPIMYLLTQTRVILHYLYLSVWPAVLCLDYGWEPVSSFREVLVPFLVVSGMGLVTLWATLRGSKAGFLGFFFFAFLAPTSSFVSLYDVAFEHRMYLPLASAIVVLVLGSYHVLQRLGTGDREKRALCVLAVLILAALGIRTVIRNRDYASEEIIWRKATETNPDNLRAQNGLAVALAERGNYGDAMKRFEYILQATEGVKSAWDGRKWREPFQMANNSPENNRFRALVNLGAMSVVRGNLSGAAEQYAQALRIYPYSDGVSARLRWTMLRLGAPEDRVDAMITRWLRQDSSVKVSEVLGEQ